MLVHFPNAYPDELFFSLIARVHFREGGGSCAARLTELFGVRSYIPDSVLPSHLKAFVRQLPYATAITPESIALAYTLFPYYRPFMSRATESKTLRDMASSNGGALFARLGLLRSDLRSVRALRYCEKCVPADMDTLGEPYWRRAHQLPGVLVCHSHGTRLKVIRAQEVGRHDLFLPAVGPAQQELLGLEGARISGLWRFAQLSTELLRLELPRIDPHHLQAAYLAAFNEKNWLTAGRKVKTKRVFSDLIEYWGSSTLQAMDVSLRRASMWIGDLATRRRPIQHPAKHLLLIGPCFASIAGLSEAARHAQVNRGKTAIQEWQKDPRINLHRLQVMFERGDTLTAIAAALKSTVTTIAVHARAMGLKVRRRPKRVVPGIEQRVLALLAADKPLPEIAADSGISISSVSRILRTRPRLIEMRKTRAQQLRLKTARQDWMSAGRSALGEGIKAAKRKAPAAYAFLYRNDRDWLAKNLPKAKAKAEAQKVLFE